MLTFSAHLSTPPRSVGYPPTTPAQGLGSRFFRCLFILRHARRGEADPSRTCPSIRYPVCHSVLKFGCVRIAQHSVFSSVTARLPDPHLRLAAETEIYPAHIVT